MKTLISITLLALLSISGTANAEQSPTAQAVIEQAQTNDANAQVLAGDMYAFGEHGTEPSYEEAFKWYEKAAAQGNEQAKFNMSIILMVGKDWKQQEQHADDSLTIETETLTN